MSLDSIQALELETTPGDQRQPAVSIHTKPQSKSSYSEAFLNLYKCCIGSGILAAPFTFFKGGYILASMSYFIVGILMVYSQLMLLRIVDEIPQENMGFSEITLLILGNNYLNVSRMFIIVMQWGCCASYVLFFMEFFEYAIYKTTEATFEHELIYMAVALCIIIPLIFIDSMRVFSRFSAIANALINISLIACMVYFVIELVDDVNYNDIPIAEITQLPLVLGVAIYSFEGIGVLLNVRLSMTNVSEFPKLMTIVYALGTIQNWVFGLVGSLAYGYLTNQIILFSLGTGSETFQIMYALGLVISLPLMLLPAFQLIERIAYIKPIIKGNLMTRTGIRFLQVCAIAGLAIGIPEFAVLISFIGGFSGAALQFFFPLMFYLKWTWKNQPTRKEGYIFIALMIVGILMGAVAVADSVYQIASGQY